MDEVKNKHNTERVLNDDEFLKLSNKGKEKNHIEALDKLVDMLKKEEEESREAVNRIIVERNIVVLITLLFTCLAMGTFFVWALLTYFGE